MAAFKSTSRSVAAASERKMAHVTPAPDDLYAHVTREVSLGGTLKARPAKARVERIGIVPDQCEGESLARESAEMAMVAAADLIFPANGGTGDTNVVSHGGAIASGVPVQLVFWGSAWNSPSNSQLRAQFVAAAAGLIAGPYFRELKQYGAARPTFRGAITMTAPNPPSSFDDGDVGDAVWNLIDANVFPEPDENGGRNFYCLLMPPGTSYGPGGALGAHSFPTDYDFPFDIDTAWVAWVGFSDLNTMTRAFGHELAETCSDPEGDGWYVDSSGAEIGDLCNSRRAFVRGVFVEGYWSKRHNACVIPQSLAAQVSPLARMSNHLDLFVTGNDGRVYTSWWHEGQDWSGINNNWRSIGGFFPVGSTVSSLARMSNHLDLFIVGNDGRVYTSWWHEGQEWSGISDNWRPIGGFFPVGAMVSAIARASNQIDLFITGNDGRVYTSWWHEAQDWSGVRNSWRNIGGVFPPGAPVSAVARMTNHLDLFIVGNDGRVYTAWWHQGQDWSGINDNWRPVGGFFPAGSQVTALARETDQLDLFVCGNDGRVYTSWWHEGQDWSGINNNWRSIGGVFPVGASVSAIARMSNHLDLFVVGNDGRVYTSWWHEGQDWSGINDNWRAIGGFFPPGTTVTAVARESDQIDLFVTGNDGRVYTSWWHEASDWSGINDNWRAIGGFFPTA